MVRNHLLSLNYKNITSFFTCWGGAVNYFISEAILVGLRVKGTHGKLTSRKIDENGKRWSGITYRPINSEIAYMLLYFGVNITSLDAQFFHF